MSHWFRDFSNILNESLQDEIDAYHRETEPEIKAYRRATARMDREDAEIARLRKIASEYDYDPEDLETPLPELDEEESADVRGKLYGSKPIPTLAMNVKSGDLIGLSPEAYVNSNYGSAFDAPHGQNKYIQGVVGVHVDGGVTHIKFNSNKEVSFPSNFEVLVFGSGWHDMTDTVVSEDLDIKYAITEAFSFTGILNESVDFHPSVKTIEPNGQVVIGWPDSCVKKVKEPCFMCDYHHEHHPDSPAINPHCTDCGGTGFFTKTEYDLPEMNVSNRNAGVIASMLGFDHPEDYSHGWIPPENLPDARRKLIRILNDENEAFGHTIEPSETSSKTTYVDRSGDVPEIKTQGGARMIDAGVSRSQIHSYATRLLELIDWAQKNNCGISWA